MECVSVRDAYFVRTRPIPCGVRLLQCWTVRHRGNDCFAVGYRVVLALLAKQSGRNVDTFGLGEIEDGGISEQEWRLSLDTPVWIGDFAFLADVPIDNERTLRASFDMAA